MKDLRQFTRANRDRILAELKDFLRIPSVSTAPRHSADCLRAAKWLTGQLERLECGRIELLGSDTHPVVWAEGPLAPGKPTVLVYGHYDVQPPDPMNLWKSAPFEPTVRNGNLYARGSSDDKGQVFAILKAVEAVNLGSRPPVNVRFMIEGQEESGSYVLFDLLKQEPDRVGVDAVLVADMPYFAPRAPAIYTGLRGICYTEITLRTLRTDLHSGMYGGVAPNAHETLIRLLARLKDADGRVQIPGFYEAILPPSQAEHAVWKGLPLDDEKYRRREVGARALTGLKGKSVLERTWALPTLEIHGITGGFTDAGAKAVIPAEATAKVSFRLAPNQKASTVARQLKDAVRNLAPDYARATVRVMISADPVLVDTRARPFSFLDQAFYEVEGRRPVPIRSGGSIPIVPALRKRRAPVLLSGIGLPDDGLHAPNEKLNLNQFWKGVRIFGRFFQLMGNQ